MESDLSMMEKLRLEATRVTPYIYFDPNSGSLEIRGKSSPENTIVFYQKLFDKLEEYIVFGMSDLTVNIFFEYFNTSSSKCLFDLFRKLSLIDQTGRKVVINWYFESWDEDMYESGEDYKDLLEVEFNLVETEDEF
ncbi:MAG: DUF1987 domain-containing protein [Cyclobacteriaceae bacterium]